LLERRSYLSHLTKRRGSTQQPQKGNGLKLNLTHLLKHHTATNLHIKPNELSREAGTWASGLSEIEGRHHGVQNARLPAKVQCSHVIRGGDHRGIAEIHQVLV
jgi:hypothetical protein